MKISIEADYCAETTFWVDGILTPPEDLGLPGPLCDGLAALAEFWHARFDIDDGFAEEDRRLFAAEAARLAREVSGLLRTPASPPRTVADVP